MTDVRTARLTPADRDLARRLFALIADVFGEPCAPLTDAYLDRLLARPDFFALAALAGDDVVAGLTAHALPMTRAEASEVLLYDLAVRPDRQRIGVGRLLMAALREAASAAGVGALFVPVDNDDEGALAFYRAVGGAPSPVTHFSFPDPND